VAVHEVIVIGVVLAAAIGLVVSRDAEKQRRAVWQTVARDRGGVHHIPTGWFTRERERIEIMAGEIRAVLETYTQGSGKNRTHYTAVTAFAPNLGGPIGRVYKQGILASIGKALGTQDVVLGSNDVFDRAFMVKTDEPALMRRLWSPRAMELMLGPLQGVVIETHPDRIVLESADVWGDPARMHAGFDLVLELASQDLYGEAALRAVPGGAFALGSTGIPEVALDVPLRVVIRTEPVADHMVSVARLTERVDGEPLSVAIKDGRCVDPALASQLPQGAHVPMRQVGSGRLVMTKGGASFTWRAVELDPDRLRAGAELIGAIAAAPTGVYR
jgi:hypothetical protein